MKERFLITLATGTTGFALARQLLAEGHSVRAYVRSRNARALELEKAGAELAFGEFHEPGQVAAALRGVTRVYYCYPMKRGLVDDIGLYIEAAREANVDVTVFMGQWLAEFPDAPSVLTRDIQQAYRQLEASGLRVVTFNPGFFADNLVALTDTVVQMGMMPSPWGQGRCPWISTGDLARCAAALLKNPEPHIGRRVHPTGAKAVDAEEMAQSYSRVLGRPVVVRPSSDRLFLKAILASAREFGYDEFVAVQTLHYARELRRDRFGEANSVVRELTGREPEDFDTIVRGFIAALPDAVPSGKGRRRVLGSFVRTLFTPVPSVRAQKALNV